MWYEYRCLDCGKQYEDQIFTRIGEVHPFMVCQCVQLGGLVRIVSMPQVTPTAPEPYFNHTVGQMVTSTRDFEEKLRIGGLKMEERTGIPNNYQPLYPSEGKAHIAKVGGDDERLEGKI